MHVVLLRENLSIVSLSVRLRALERKRDHVVDGSRAEDHHQQTVETERDAGTIRQPGFERGEETFVGGRRRQSTTAALVAVALEAA
jgi:hypothetical protein